MKPKNIIKLYICSCIRETNKAPTLILRFSTKYVWFRNFGTDSTSNIPIDTEPNEQGYKLL